MTRFIKDHLKAYGFVVDDALRVDRPAISRRNQYEIGVAENIVSGSI